MFCPIRCCLFEPYVAKDQKCQTSNKYLSYHDFRWEKCYWQQLIIFVHTVPWSRVANCSPGTSARAGLHISALTKSHIHGSASTVTYRRPPSKLWRIACNVDPKSIIAFHFHLWSTKELSLETFVWNKYVYLYTNRFIEKLSSSSSNFWWTNTSITNGRCNFIDAQLLIFRGRFLKLFGYFLRKISY